MDIPQDAYERIAQTIENVESPVGIDAKKTHIWILYKLEQIEARLLTLEDRFEEQNR